MQKKWLHPACAWSLPPEDSLTCVVQSCAWFGTRACVLQPTLFKSGDDNSTLKVIIEIRENKSMRQFLNNETLVAKCNGPEAQAAIKALNVG